MGFKKRRGINLSYIEQGVIAFTCWTFSRQPSEIQDKIRSLCYSCGGEHHKALFDVMTRSDMSITSVAAKYFVSESTLYRIRKDFYESWFEVKVGDNEPHNLIE